MNEKNCPFCGKSKLESPQLCVCNSETLMHMTRGDWNNRPIEGALTAENERLRGIIVEMLNIFDREGTAPRKEGYSIGAMCCDRARAALSDKEVK